jgi:hypothetical protein
VIGQLASVNAARTYVRETLLPRARSGDAVIIVTRKVKTWELKAATSFSTKTGRPAVLR